ncbi:MAG: hypothetical protein KatS3mg011_1044 [Acidimicrobiia bacterium]|nr:MAG: hypothetical protein KatS3mg011_1044 [Acidimicrobiia bacterium]
MNPSAKRLLFVVGGIVVLALGGALGWSLAREASAPDRPDEYGSVTVTGAALPPGTGPSDLEAPSFTTQTPDGVEISVTPGDGTPKVLVFLAHWCPHCQAEVPRIVAWHRDTSGLDGLEVVGVATATDRLRVNYPPSDWLEREGWPYPVALDDADNSIARAYGVDSFPFFVVVDSEGRAVFRVSGELDTATLDELMRTAAGL